MTAPICSGRKYEPRARGRPHELRPELHLGRADEGLAAALHRDDEVGDECLEPVDGLLEVLGCNGPKPGGAIQRGGRLAQIEADQVRSGSVLAPTWPVRVFKSPMRSK